MSNNLVGHDRQINGEAPTAKSHNKSRMLRYKSCNLPCSLFRGLNATTQLLDESDSSSCHCVEPSILQVDVLSMLRMWRKGERECLREHPQYAHAAHQVAMFEQACSICYDVIRVQTARDTTSDQCSVHSTRDRVWQRAQLQEPMIQLAKSQGEPSGRHIQV
jgi:hypothetical protein